MSRNFLPFTLAAAVASSTLAGACGSASPVGPSGGHDAGEFDVFVYDSGTFPDAAAPRPAPAEDPSERLPGGATTSDDVGPGAFARPVANLAATRRAAYEAGLQLFQADWVSAPGRVELDGLGPTFNAVACTSCHHRGGRGPVAAILLRLADDVGSSPDAYGIQLQPFGIAAVLGEGIPVREERPIAFQDALGRDRSRVDVRYRVDRLAFGPFPTGTRLSPRIGPALAGQGLLEAIPDAALGAAADPDDKDGDGISGRVAWTAGAAGHFGWKSGAVDLPAQTAGALYEDLGLTSDAHPEERCPAPQTACRAAPHGGTPEVPKARFDALVQMLRLTAVPARRDPGNPEVLRGRSLFYASGCAGCHTPKQATGRATEPEVAGQTIWPYTDLLLHDLGAELADRPADGSAGPEPTDRREGPASPSEWRTPPLWGIGLFPTVHGEQRLLHDGRAPTVAAAISHHDGEGRSSRLAFERLTDADQQALLTFVNSL